MDNGLWQRFDIQLWRLFLHSLRPFNGDFDELASLMKASWSENRKEPLDYTPSFLRSALHQPGLDFELCPSIYQDGRLIAFGAGFPRTLQMKDGSICQALLDSFITVASGHKGQGLGREIWSGIAGAGKARAFDGLITFCVEGDRMNDQIPRYASECNLPTGKSLLVRYLARPVRNRDGAAPQLADPTVLSQYTPANVSFTRLWSEPEALWQCVHREGAFGCTFRSREVVGTISAYKMSTAGKSPVLCGLVDYIVWPDLQHEERRDLVNKLLDAAAAAGVQLLLVPILGYTSMDAFTSSGFRMTSRALQMYLTALSGRFEISNVTAACIDVF